MIWSFNVYLRIDLQQPQHDELIQVSGMVGGGGAKSFHTIERARQHGKFFSKTEKIYFCKFNFLNTSH